MSRTTKSARKMNLSTLMSTSSMTPQGKVTKWSSSYNDTIVGFTSPIPSLHSIDISINLTLDHKSHKVLPTFKPLISQGSVQLPRSLSFCDNFL